MKKIELLAPAGSLDKLKIAYLYGADACYVGGVQYSMRANAKNFTYDELKEAVEYAHNLHKKIYVTVNIVLHKDEEEELLMYLRKLEKLRVDAVIVSDMGVINTIVKNKLRLKIHVSTQDSIANREAVNFLKKYNIERVVLARECSGDDIKDIIDNTGVEVECFLQGAMCVSYSGRCVMSNYFTGRDANRGACAQICRWTFPLEKDGNIINSDTEFTMSCKDLSLINNIGLMIDMGVTSLKVEGRMRSSYYIATVISTYREAIDLYYKNKLTRQKRSEFARVLNRVANRDSVSQFIDKFPGVDEQYFLGREEVSNQDFLGIVMEYDDNTKMVTISERNYFKKGDKVVFFGPGIDSFEYVLDEFYDSEGNLIDVARHPKEIIKFKVPHKLYPSDIMRIYF